MPRDPVEALHDKLRILLQNYANTHKLRVSSIEVSWLSIDNSTECSSMINTLGITTESHHT